MWDQKELIVTGVYQHKQYPRKWCAFCRLENTIFYMKNQPDFVQFHQIDPNCYLHQGVGDGVGVSEEFCASVDVSVNSGVGVGGWIIVSNKPPI